MAQDIATFRARSGEVSVQSWATVRGTKVCNKDGNDKPWLKVSLGHPAAGSSVFQQPLCSLPVLAVATILSVGQLWL